MTTKMYSLLKRYTCLLLGFAMIAAGFYLYRNWIDMFTRMRGKEMALSTSSPAYKDWKVSPLPLNFDVYLFNWTNPEDFRVGATRKPHFEQLGPYRFREMPDKVDIQWNKDNDTVSFRKKATFFFDAAGSNGTLDDHITTVNTVAHSAALRSRDDMWAKFTVGSTLRLYRQGVTETKTAREWIFSGYSHPLVTLGKIFFPDNVPFDRVGWLYTRNDSSTYDGYFNMYTGADDISKMGQVHMWNNKTNTGAFEGTCGDVKGSMGEFFPPNLSTNDSISLFLPNLCRAVPLDYTETVTVHGVTAYKFSGGERAIDNGTLFPETKCYCVGGKCEAAGVINIAPCKYNSSIYMSYPHFYKADPSYLEAIDGLKPEKEKHEFFMTLEPNAGVPMDVGGGFQANYLMEPVPGIGPFSNIPRTFIPIMWCEERVRVTPEIASDIALVPLFVLLGQIATGVLLAGGLICVGWYPMRLLTHLFSGDAKSRATLLKPLANGVRVPSISATSPQLPSHKPGEGVHLLSYRRSINAVENGRIGDDIDDNNDVTGTTVTESLLGSTLRVQSDVLSR